MTISLRGLLALIGCFWAFTVATGALAWWAGQSQVAPIQVQPGGASVNIQPQEIRVEGASIQVPGVSPPIVQVAAPSPVITVLPAELPKVDVHAVVNVDTVQAQRVTLGPLPKDKPDVDEHGTLIPRPK